MRENCFVEWKNILILIKHNESRPFDIFLFVFFIGWRHALFELCGWQAYRRVSFSPTPFTVTQSSSSSLLLFFSKKCIKKKKNSSAIRVGRIWDNGRSRCRCNRRPTGRRMFRENEQRGTGAIIEIGFIFGLFKQRRTGQKREWGPDSKGSSSNTRLQCSATAYLTPEVFSFRWVPLIRFRSFNTVHQFLKAEPYRGSAVCRSFTVI